MMLLLIVSIVGFFALSGLMAAVDAAVLSVTHPEIEVLIQKGKWGARRLSRAKQDISRSVVVIVILSNTINVLGPVLVSLQAFELYGSEVIAIITAMLTVGTIVFSEIVPKSIGTHYAPLIARGSAPAILVIGFFLYPLVAGFARLSGLFTPGTRMIGTEEQIRSLVQIGRRAGHIESDEGQMIHRVFVLNDKSADEIMTPLGQVKSLSAHDTIQRAATEVVRNEYSRYPVFGQSPDQIEGLALTREVLKAALDRPLDPLAKITRAVVVVDAKTKSDELISIFRNRHAQLAIVQQTGKTVGIVTLADVLDQLIGNATEGETAGLPQVDAV